MPNAQSRLSGRSAGNNYSESQSRELEASQEAALEAAKSAREAQLASEKLQSQIAELKAELNRISNLATGCADLAKKAENNRRAAALKAKKEAEEKLAIEAAPLAQPTIAMPKGSPEYSKSDAPPGYFPPKAQAPVTPAPETHDHH